MKVKIQWFDNFFIIFFQENLPEAVMNPFLALGDETLKSMRQELDDELTDSDSSSSSESDTGSKKEPKPEMEMESSEDSLTSEMPKGYIELVKEWVAEFQAYFLQIVHLFPMLDKNHSTTFPPISTKVNLKKLISTEMPYLMPGFLS